MLNRVVWKDIPGYEGLYQISNFGEVYSLITKKVLKQSNTTTGYKKVELYKEKKKKSFKVHRLVMYSFVGIDKSIVNHIDGDPHNNNLENLEYCNQSYNMKHAYQIGLVSCNYIGNQKEILNDYESGLGLKSIARKYRVGESTIKNILSNNDMKVRSISEAQNKYNINLTVLNQLIEKGLSNKQIAKILNCPNGLIATRRYQIKKGIIVC